MSIINIYAGYYEIFVTDKKLKKPYVLQYQAATEYEANAYLMDIDDHIFVDKDLPGIDYFTEVMEVKNGRPQLLY